MAPKIGKKINFRFIEDETLEHEIELWITSRVQITSHSKLRWQKDQHKDPLISPSLPNALNPNEMPNLPALTRNIYNQSINQSKH